MVRIFSGIVFMFLWIGLAKGQENKYPNSFQVLGNKGETELFFLNDIRKANQKFVSVNENAKQPVIVQTEIFKGIYTVEGNILIRLIDVVNSIIGNEPVPKKRLILNLFTGHSIKNERSLL